MDKDALGNSDVSETFEGNSNLPDSVKVVDDAQSRTRAFGSGFEVD